MKEAEFIQASTAKEQELEETIAKLQEVEAELENVYQQQQTPSELHKGEMKQLVKQLEQLQQTTERDRENNEFIRYHAIEAERQKWEAHEARLIAQLDEAMQRIASMRDQSETRRNTRPLSIAEESDENIVSVGSIASLTVSHTHTDVVNEEVTDKNEIKRSDSALCESVKPAVTIVLPVADSYVISTSPVLMLNQLSPTYYMKFW